MRKSKINISGFKIGTAENRDGLTGVTVILAPDGGATAGVDVRGCAPGTRETDLLDPRKTVQKIHAVVLSGGSAFGLEAASGCVKYLAEKAVASTVEQRVYETVKTHKFSLLVRHLKEINPYMAVIFCNTREGAHELAGRLQEETDLVVDEIHGNMSQGQRNQVIREFEKARTQVLVASDIAARGLDVEGITHVFNYDIPRNLEYYIHRIGRTGRAGTQGVSVTYATPEDILLLRKLEKAIKEIITKYDEKGNIRRIKGPSAKKKVILPGMYKPTKKKEHKVLGHKGSDMRKKKKKGEAKGSRRGE